MALLPISATRTSTPLSNQRLLFQLNNDQLAIQRQYDQLSTGQRVLSLSDDPAAANRAITLHRSIDNSNQLVRNATSTRSFYQAADDSLAQIDNALIEARGAAVLGAQNVISDDERAALGATLQQTIDRVVAAGNSMFRDHQQLGGFLNSASSFNYDQKDIVFSGKSAIGRTEIGAGTPAEINLTANAALGANAVIVDGTSLDAALDADSRLVDLRQGRGVVPGEIRLSGGGNWVDLDLSNAATIGDVVELISTIKLDDRPVVASLTNDGIRIEYQDGLGGTLAIADGVGSTMAAELAISNPTGVQAPPIIGDRLSPRVTSATKISDLANGAGLDLSDGIQIIQGDKTFTVNFDGAEDLSDVLIAINRSGADVTAELDQAEGRIVLRSQRMGVDYSIGENGGDTAAALGIRSADTTTSLASLGRDRGLALNPNSSDLTIIRPDGVELEFDLEGAETIADVIDLIRNHPQNQDTRRVLVDLNDFGNGLQLKAPPGAGALTVTQTAVSNAGTRLGLIPLGQNTSSGGVVGSVDTIVGEDYATRDAGGALDTLLRLQRAVESGDGPEIERLQAKLDIDLDRASRVRGKVGVWTQNLDQLQETTETRVIQLRAQLSEEIDADLTEVISELGQRQVSLEASLRIIGQTASMTVLNYL
ncbi:Flagellar hook-associated protein 3 [Rubripirellula lacrimiformis]|uniref:Flagellar hook-associated protein 3 n=1 Tax=Rubripirellula lacrimiformis TaxID=1930273 RepID=A0A517NEN8_9BACT|nr:flagellin hook IN motif-containing protein [Rubripirellula lacrimiformis]QDT05592.1 Flagellar hook-associated protein 3 [Rubripirellula lacrimiformis]